MSITKKKNDIMSLIENVFNEFMRSDFTNCIVPFSIPIIWFGDVESYFKSRLKVITVSLNPSNNEFGNTKKDIAYTTKFRFPDFDGTSNTLYNAYNNYFKSNPYNSWFKASFKSTLKSFSASFYGDEENIARMFCSVQLFGAAQSTCE